MKRPYNPNYPLIDDLRQKAKRRIPKFAFEYLDGGCNEEINLYRNTADIRDIELVPQYLRPYGGIDMKTALFGHVYDAPFGIAPVGLQGLMWPNAAEILAKAAFEENIPFILSTVTTTDIERASELTEGRAWFQLYYPAEEKVRNSIIDRAAAAQAPVLVLLSDVPTFGYRGNDIKNGLSMPPRMTARNMYNILKRPKWALKTLQYGQPRFKTLEPYMPKGLDMSKLGQFMDKTFSGRLNEERIKPIRDRWKGKLVLKGVASNEDVERAIALGLDGVIVSNHGGRQLDAGTSSIKALSPISEKYGDKITVMMDSGLRSGPDIARTMAKGAAFTFLGRSFMYGVAALGEQGGLHTIRILKTQLKQVMEQICCEHAKELHKHLNSQ